MVDISGDLRDLRLKKIQVKEKRERQIAYLNVK